VHLHNLFLNYFHSFEIRVMPLRTESDIRICKLLKSLDFKSSLQLILYPFMGVNLMLSLHGLPACWEPGCLHH